MRHFRLQVRFSGQIASTFLIALVAIAFLAGSVSVLGQTSAPSSKATGSPAATQAQSGTGAESTNTAEHDEMNVYRHAPIVRSLAKMLHLDVESTARLFEILNFVIIALAIGIPLIKLFPKVLRKRAQTLKHSLDSARKMTEEAHARMSAVEEKLAKLGNEIAEIRAHVEEEGKNDEARIKATIEEESGRIVAAAEQEIAAAAAHAKRGLKNFAADLAIDQAARQLVLTPETDRALIGEFMKETAKGGKN
ncbi:MAG TPA: ATP synthase F0 subunit B [Terracidiphilus sp.]|nr:ATP synthase F0 subunit B [Terracidiphilus sp.]